MEFVKTELQLQTKVDDRTKRHFLNDQLFVLHCHHYSTLYTQLAMDAGETSLLTDVAEEVFLDLLKTYFCKHSVSCLQEKIELACQYYAAMGLGKMKVGYCGEDSGEVELLKSHLDEGWKKKWGQHNEPVNYIGKGYVAAMFAAFFDAPKGTFTAQEVQSIAMGAEKSTFRVVKA